MWFLQASRDPPPVGHDYVMKGARGRPRTRTKICGMGDLDIKLSVHPYVVVRFAVEVNSELAGMDPSEDLRDVLGVSAQRKCLLLVVTATQVENERKFADKKNNEAERVLALFKECNVQLKGWNPDTMRRSCGPLRIIN